MALVNSETRKSTAIWFAVCSEQQPVSSGLADKYCGIFVPKEL